MHRTWIAGALIALGLLGPIGADTANPPLALKAERMTLEYNPADNEAALSVAAESEVGLQRVEVRNGAGTPVLMMRGYDAGNLGVYGFKVETDASDAQALLSSYPEGLYHVRCRTVGGELAVGLVSFTHALPQTPTITSPLEGALDVPTTNLSVSWSTDATASGYRVSLEQGETDMMTVELGAGTGSFQIPNGLLAPQTRYWVEVAAIAPNGNATVSKIPFMTM